MSMERPYKYPPWDNTDDWVNEKEAQRYYDYGDAIRNTSKYTNIDHDEDEKIGELELTNRWLEDTNSNLQDEIYRLKKENSKFRKIKRALDIIKTDKRKLFSVGVLKKCLKNG